MTTPNQRAELLPCPFCDGAPKLSEVSTTRPRYRVACVAVDCPMEIVVTRDCYSADEAGDLWNTRGGKR